MVQVLRSTKTAYSIISINTVVRSALDLSQVGHLMESCGSLILSMAGAAKSRKATEIEWAVDHKALGRKSIGEDIAAARAVYI
jgi:hypothetical protein